jgi:hypothetical protein
MAGAIFFALTQFASADDAAGTDAAKLQLEVSALTTLNDLHVTAAQIPPLRDLLSDIAGPVPTLAKVDPAYQAAESDLKAALLSGDDDKIDQAREKVADLEDNLAGDAQADVELNDAARNKATPVLKLMSTHQIATFLGNNADDISDPAETVLEVLDHSHGTTDDDFADLRDDAADEIEMLAAGLVPEKKPAIEVKIVAFLNKARKLSDADFAQQRQALTDEAKKLGQEINPIVAIRHWTEQQMAQLLVNPELATALDEYKPPQDSGK